MRKAFLWTLAFCLLLFATAAQAAQITDVKWGVDKNNVLRLVVDVTESAGYAVECAGSDLKLTVNAKTAAQVPKIKKIKSSLADELRVVDGGSYAEVHLPLKQEIGPADYKAFVLKQDAKTGRPFRVVLDVAAPKQAAAAKPVAAASTAKPVVGNKPVASAHPAASAAPPSASTEKTTPAPSNNSAAVVSKVPTTQNASAEKTAPSAAANTAATVVGRTPASQNTTAARPAKQAAAKIDAAPNKSATIVSTGSTPKSSVKTQKKEPLAIKSKSKFRTGGGMKGKIITLDPGHGGTDPGAIGASGLKEKQITLEIALRVKELLEKKGVKVYMTRTKDVDVCGPNASDNEELQARVNVAEKNNSDLFISLHINASVNKNVGGFSSYYYPKTDNDLKIAQKIQNQFAKNFGLENLGVRQANFYVVKRCSMPATLLEMGFISNEKEEKLMKGKWFQKKTARLITEGVEDYFD